MNEPIPPLEPAPAELAPAHVPSGARINWHRARVYLLSLLLIAAMWIGGTVVTIRLYPRRVVDKLLALVPFPSSTGKVEWLNRRTLKIEDVKIGGFFYAESITIVASPFGLWRHHISKVVIVGGQVFTRPLYAAMDQAGASQGRGLDWVIARLEISRGTVMLENVISDTSIPVRLGVRYPIVLNALRLGQPDASPEMKQERTVEIGAVNISSPFDPVAPVFSFPLTRVRFTYSEFWHHHIREVDVVRPTMHLGEDLFWLTDKFKAESATTTAQGPGAPWRIGHFQIEYGQLAVNAFGQPVAHLPFFFDTKVDDIRLDQLDQISARSTIAIRRLDEDYPDYKIRLENLTGRLYFSWPPTGAKANNVVNTINIDEASWNGIAAKGVNTTVTFDPNGVFGKLYGTCEGGQLAGNFEFYYAKDFAWNADFFASDVNCQPIAEKMAGRYVDLTGRLSGKIAVQGKSTQILNCAGSLDLPNAGRLEIKSMDELINRLPANMIRLKRDALKIAIDSFQTYPYDRGHLQINYTPQGGLGTLKLDGPRGLRLFEVYWHP